MRLILFEGCTNLLYLDVLDILLWVGFLGLFKIPWDRINLSLKCLFILKPCFSIRPLLDLSSEKGNFFGFPFSEERLYVLLQVITFWFNSFLTIGFLLKLMIYLVLSVEECAKSFWAYFSASKPILYAIFLNSSLPSWDSAYTYSASSIC